MFYASLACIKNTIMEIRIDLKEKLTVKKNIILWKWFGRFVFKFAFFNKIEAAPKTEVTTLAEVCGSWHLAPKLESEQK